MQLAKLLEQLPDQISGLMMTLERKHMIAQYAPQLDFVAIRAQSQIEFHKWLEEVASIGSIEQQYERSGAQQLYVLLTKPLVWQDQRVQLLIVDEPRPNKIYPLYGLYRLGLHFGDKFAGALDKWIPDQKERAKYTELGVYEAELENGFKLELRERAMAQDVDPKNNTPTSSSQANQPDLSSELQAERSAKLQVMADFQNYRKRMEKERSTFGLMANMEIVNDILDVVDDVKRTIADQDKDLARSQTMFNIVQDKLLAAVSKVGLEMVEVKNGDAFDSSLMEAVGTVAVADVDSHNKVIAVVQPAYKYKDGDQLMRHAKVIVGKKEVQDQD